jgi:hypothetical protein
VCGAECIKVPDFQILAARDSESRVSRVARLCLPFLPAGLPVLLFCRLAELSLALGPGRPALRREVWLAMVEEWLLLEWTANDIKIIGNHQFSSDLYLMLLTFQKSQQNPSAS